MPLDSFFSSRKRFFTVLKGIIVVAVVFIDFWNLKNVESFMRHDEVPNFDVSLPMFDVLDPQSTHTPLSSSAYAFLIGGCDPANRASYQNYLFNVAISARILKRLGSQMDVVALFQISQSATQMHLPKEDLQLLQSQNVTVFYIPQQKSGQESFYRTTVEKFRILGLTQYEKILFLDGDLMPLCNLDFFFSHETFEEVVVMEGLHEPFNAGFFMVKTGRQRLQEVQEIIERREREALKLPDPYFDLTMGWGYNLTEDPWVSAKSSGKEWTFLCAFSDQGLLYYYAKYHCKSFSMLNRRGGLTRYDSTGSLNETSARKVGAIDWTLDNYSSVIEPLAMKVNGKHRRHPFPQRCMLHFTGSNKPWLKGGAPTDCCTNETQYNSGKHYWMYELHELLTASNRTIDLRTYWDSSNLSHRPALGLFPKPDQVLNAQTNILTPLQLVDYDDLKG